MSNTSVQKLDDKEFVLKLDPKGMYDLTINFPQQCRKALGIAEAADVSSAKPGSKYKNVVLTGLGGSAVGGDIVKCMFEEYAEVPFFVNRDYNLPKWVSNDTLVFCTSYSGNTEETLSAYEDAKNRGSQIIAVTSGGKLAELAQKDGFPLIQIPSGQPPRTALGFMLIPVLIAAEKLEFIPQQDYNALINLLESLLNKWNIESSFDNNQPKQIAAKIQGKLSNIYGLGSWQGIVANRWKGEINENAKNMAFANTLPELNHNEVLGWVKSDSQGVQNWVTIILEDGTESAKMKARAKVTSQLISDLAEVYTVRAEGNCLLEKIVALILFGDIMSIYLAALNGIDPENIDSINILKGELAKVD